MTDEEVKPKRKVGRPRTSKRLYPGQDPSLRIEPKEKPDPEEVEDSVVDATGPDPLLDDLDDPGPLSPIQAKYPSPKKNPEFRKRWDNLIRGVVSRDNFKVGHLYQLEILCDLYVEYDALAKFIRTKGYTYVALGRQGRIVKPYPQVTQINRVQAEIRSYSKMLGLLLSTDKSTESGGEDNEWS
jgi:phage terminase small subunit